MSTRLRASYSPLYCGYPRSDPEYFELRWDVVDCVLGCEFCWSPASRPESMNEGTVEYDAYRMYRETKAGVRWPGRTFLRFTGGEPTLYWHDLVDLFLLLSDDEVLRECPILIQTNGVLIGNGEADLGRLELEPLRHLRFLFELSLKGTNPREFQLLTSRDSSLYHQQLAAYDRLRRADEVNANLSFVTVLGIYHSSLKSHRSKWAFVYPFTDTLMFDGHVPWDSEFERVWSSSQRRWVERLRMSPKGLWENVIKRCGDEGAHILRYFGTGVYTNPGFVFPAKPAGYEYARTLVERAYWQ